VRPRRFLPTLLFLVGAAGMVYLMAAPLVLPPPARWDPEAFLLCAALMSYPAVCEIQGRRPTVRPPAPSRLAVLERWHQVHDDTLLDRLDEPTAVKAADEAVARLSPARRIVPPPRDPYATMAPRADPQSRPLIAARLLHEVPPRVLREAAARLGLPASTARIAALSLAARHTDTTEVTFGREGATRRYTFTGRHAAAEVLIPGGQVSIRTPPPAPARPADPTYGIF
jgi:hypothetical protein